MKDLFANLKQQLAAKANKEVPAPETKPTPADIFLASRKSFITQREEMVNTVLPVESIIEREQKRTPADYVGDDSGPTSREQLDEWESYRKNNPTSTMSLREHKLMMMDENPEEVFTVEPEYFGQPIIPPADYRSSMPPGLRELQDMNGVNQADTYRADLVREEDGKISLVPSEQGKMQVFSVERPEVPKAKPFEFKKKDEPQYVVGVDPANGNDGAIVVMHPQEGPVEISHPTSPEEFKAEVERLSEHYNAKVVEETPLEEPQDDQVGLFDGLDEPFAESEELDELDDDEHITAHIARFRQNEPLTPISAVVKDMVESKGFFTNQGPIPDIMPKLTGQDLLNQEIRTGLGQKPNEFSWYEGSNIKSVTVDHQKQPETKNTWVQEQMVEMDNKFEDIAFKTITAGSYDGKGSDKNLVDEMGQWNPVNKKPEVKEDTEEPEYAENSLIPEGMEETTAAPHKMNASKIVEHGITFDSKLENYLYNLLRAEQINFRFQVEYILQEGFRYRHEAILPIKIVIDFVLDDFHCIVDTKGWQMTDNKIKHKMLKKHLHDNKQEMRIEMPSSQKACRLLIERLRNGFTLDEPLKEGAANSRKAKLKKAGFEWKDYQWCKGSVIMDSAYLMNLPKFEFEEFLIANQS